MINLVAALIALGAILLPTYADAGTNGSNYNMKRFLNEQHPFSNVRIKRPIDFGKSIIRPLPNPQSFPTANIMPVISKRISTPSERWYKDNLELSNIRPTILNPPESLIKPGSYYSIGTFRFIENAYYLLRQYDSLQPAIVLFEKENKRLYRVVIGPIDERKKKRYGKLLSGLGLKGFWVVKIDGSEKKIVNRIERENRTKLKAKAKAKVNDVDNENIKYITGNNRPEPGIAITQEPGKKAEKLYAKSILPQPVNKKKTDNMLSEIRVGTLRHDEGPFSRRKERGIDGNLEILFSSPHNFQKIFSPRPHLGASINSAGDTNQVYIGLTWEGNLNKDIFANFSFGGGYHDGYKATSQLDKKSLGCRILFRESIDLGFRFDSSHSVMAHLDHVSNAKLCSTNEGLESVGIRYGYNF